jgi:hypothetical protein
MAARYRSAGWHDQIEPCRVVLVVLVVGWVICERVGSHDRWNVEVGRDPYTHKTVRAASGSTPAVGQARSMKKLVFVCEVSAEVRAATARALRSV